jgi:TetR/AcrR family transcriptional regulator
MPADSAYTRRAILDAAEAQFSENGFAATSMSAVAEAAMVAKGLLHHHFGSKEGLWHAVKERRFGEFWSAQAVLYETLPANSEFIEKSLRMYFAFLQANPSFVRLMTWHFIERQELQREEQVGPPQIAVAIERARECQEAGHVRSDVDPFHVVVMFFCLVVHWHEAKAIYLSWFRKGSPKTSAKEDAAYLKDMLRVFLRGLARE